MSPCTDEKYSVGGMKLPFKMFFPAMFLTFIIYDFAVYIKIFLSMIILTFRDV